VNGTQTHTRDADLNTEEHIMAETGVLRDGSNRSDVLARGGRHHQDRKRSRTGGKESSRGAPDTAAVARLLSEANDADQQSDSSSMVVLARVKRKHKEQQQKVHSSSNSDNTADNQKVDRAVVIGGNGSGGGGGVSNTSNNNSNSNGKRQAMGTSNKRVRIETVALDAAKMEKLSSSLSKPPLALKSAKQSTPSKHQQQQQQSNGRTESSSFTSSLSTSLDSSGSDVAAGRSNGNAMEGSKNGADASINSSNGSSRHKPSASDKNNSMSTATKPSHLVTDISSGTNTANNSSGSGSNSGSGSGVGSGNDTQNENGATASKGGDGTNSDEQKASNERESTVGSETGAEENTTAMDVGLKSEEAINVSNNNSHVGPMLTQGKIGSKPLIHHHHHAGRHGTAGYWIEKGDNGKLGIEHESDEGTNNNKIINNNGNIKDCSKAHQDDVDAMVSKEKILEKKRKRMNMRREYEEEVQRQMRDSSESSLCQHHESVFEPGQPVTLEDVLSFTKTARLLVQALPPFLAVHTNAAFTKLSGVDSHAIIGKPVSQIISIPEVNPNKESDSSISDNTNNKDAMSSLSGSVECNGQNDSSMATAGGTNEARQDQEMPDVGNNGEFRNEAPQPVLPSGLKIDRLIVARGYCHVHNVHVIYVPHHSNSLEGKEVNIIEGNGGQKQRKTDESKILCRMGVSPVVSGAAQHEGGANDKNNRSGGACNNRRKHRHGSQGKSTERNHKSSIPVELGIIKHFLIQLEPVDGPRTLRSRSSFSSSATDTTLEAQLMGITKTELLARRCRLESRQPPEDAEVQQEYEADPDIMQEVDESQDENSSSMEPVATCG